MKTKNMQFFRPQNTLAFEGPVPVECPHCGAYGSPSKKNTAFIAVNPGIAAAMTCYETECCNRIIYTMHEYTIDTKRGTLLSFYPEFVAPSLRDSIKKISPRFVELYKQCTFAEQNQFFDLAGSGYRNALEVLIKDFAISVLQKPESEVKTRKLADAISSYLPSIDLQQSADVIRILGNDYTHYEQKYDEITFTIFKRYIEIFINYIDMQYLILNPVVPTRLSRKNT